VGGVLTCHPLALGAPLRGIGRFLSPRSHRSERPGYGAPTLRPTPNATDGSRLHPLFWRLIAGDVDILRLEHLALSEWG
jgi:hypothetical protein